MSLGNNGGEQVADLSGESDGDGEEETGSSEEEEEVPGHKISTDAFDLANQVILPVAITYASEAGNNPESQDYTWWTGDIRLPVAISRKTELQLARVTNLVGVRTELTNVTVFIGKLKGKNSALAEIKGLGPLCDMYKNSDVFVTVSAEFGGMDLNHDMDEYGLVKDGAAEITVSPTRDTYNTFRGFGQNRQFRSGTGDFWVRVYFDHFPLKNSQKYLSRVALGMLSSEIQELEGIVQLMASNGSTIKFYKGMLAASSEKYRAEFSSGMKETSTSSTINVYGHPEIILTAKSVQAFAQFVATFTVKDPMEDCFVALELLMAGQYNLIPEMVTSMRTILLGQPVEWFDVRTSVTLYWYANEMYKSLDDNNEDKVYWGRLILRALWTLRRKTKEELQQWAGIKKFFPTDTSLELFAISLSYI